MHRKVLSFVVSALFCTQTLTAFPTNVFAEENASDTKESKQIFYGDVNEDGMISTGDAVLIEKYVLNSNANPLHEPLAADVDLDGKVTLKDAEIIFQFYSKMITYTPDTKLSEMEHGFTYLADIKWTFYPDPAKYEIINNGLSWQEAEAYCESKGGHLAVITSEREQAMIQSLIKDASLSNNFLIGGCRNENGDFEWVTGEPMTYTNWDSGEPNNGMGSNDEYYIEMYYSGVWNDCNSVRRPFVCEWEEPSKASTTSTTTSVSTTVSTSVTSTTMSTTSKTSDTTITASSATTELDTDITTYTTTTTTVTKTETTKEPFAAVTTVYDPQLEKTLNAEKNEKLKITGELTAKPMTIDEIKEAGIDVYDPDNYHYFNYSVELTFRDKPIIFTKFEVVPISNDITPGEDSPTTPSPMVIYHGEKKEVVEAPVSIPELNFTVSYYEYEDQEMFIIIYGENKWLKEFYDVQLIVMNTDKETLEDCSATINVPEGLTLCNSEQTQYLGDLLPYAARDVHWYLRGDVAGDYSISALLKGKNDGDTFSYPFTTQNDIHVYAGDALKMTIAVPGYSCYKYNYPIKITMTNTSDKPIYNLQHSVKADHGYYSYTHICNDGTHTCIKSKVPLGGTSKTIDVDELLPDESAVIELSISDMWKSPLQKRLETSKLFVDAISLGVKSTIGGFIAGFASKFVDGITVIHVLDSTVVTTLKDSTTEVPYELIVTDNLDEIGKDRTFSLTEAIVSSAIDQGSETLKLFYYETLTFTSAFEFVSGIKSEAEADWKRVENNEITVEQFQQKYNLEYLDYIFGNLGNIFNTLGWESAGIVEVENDIYKIVSVPVDFSGGTAYVTDKDGNIIQKGDSVSRAPKPGSFKTVRASEEPDFEFEILTGDFEYSNGIYSFSEDSLIRMKANEPGEIYTVHFVADDGNEDQFTFITVPKHECNSDKYYVVSGPKSEEDGIAMQFCEVCGKPLDSRHIPASFCAMLSDGQMFQNVYQAAEYAENNYEETELSLFGDITLDKDLLIPANVKLLITPFANITFNNSVCIVVGSNHIDFTKNLKKYISEDKSLINNDNKPATTTVSAVNTNIPISATTTAVTTTVTQQTTNTGDLNSDGIINAVDASIVLTHYAMISTNHKSELSDTQKLSADVNKDGKIDAVDASCILSYYAYTSTTKDTTKKTLEEFLKS